MVLINYATKEIVAKVVYYGPALCGKTTNLQYIYTKLNPKKRGKMISLATESDRTLFFDFLPLELGRVQGFKVKFQLYTVPGQVFYGATRKLVLKGADAVVFVADSQEAVLDMNLESIEDMKQNLRENNLDPETIPLVIQYNKRDLNGIMEIEELERTVNWRGVPHTEAVAITGPGVMDTFKEITRYLITDLKKKHALLDGGGIKELPPEVFEEYEPPAAAVEEEVLDADDIVYEIEHGSGYYDEESSGEVVAGELLDMMETITLADASQAEAFFDNVRQGTSAEEAKVKALGVEADEPAIELSQPSGPAGEAEFIFDRQDESEYQGERELTPDELEFSEPEDIAEFSAAISHEHAPSPKPVQPKAAATPAPTTAQQPRMPAATPKPPQAQKPAQSAPVQTQAPVVDTAVLDRKFDAVQETLSRLALDMASIGARVDNQKAAPQQSQAQPDISPELEAIRDSLGRIEQEVSALRMGMTLLKESNHAASAGGTGSGAEVQAMLDSMKKELKDAIEGQDKLLLSILAAFREGRQANNDAHEKQEDALRYIAGNLHTEDKGGKKKWF